MGLRIFLISLFFLLSSPAFTQSEEEVAHAKERLQFYMEGVYINPTKPDLLHELTFTDTSLTALFIEYPEAEKKKRKDCRFVVYRQINVPYSQIANYYPRLTKADSINTFVIETNNYTISDRIISRYRRCNQDMEIMPVAEKPKMLKRIELPIDMLSYDNAPAIIKSNFALLLKFYTEQSKSTAQ